MGVYVVFMAVFALFGSAIGLKMFTKNSWGVQVLRPHLDTTPQLYAVQCCIISDCRVMCCGTDVRFYAVAVKIVSRWVTLDASCYMLQRVVS